MSKSESDYIKIRKMDILIILFLALAFAVGYFFNDFAKGKLEIKDKNTCINFCDLADLEFAFVKDRSCYCYQRQIFYSQQKNKTIEIYMAVNAGIIKNITTVDGLTQEARSMLTNR